MSDAVERAKAQLVEQFKNRSRIRAMIEAFVGQVADLEDALEELRTGRSLDQAQGAQLDGLGTIIGLPRGGMDDEQYRARLRVQIRLLYGEGTPEDILGAVSLATGGAALRLHESQPAELRLVVEDGIPPEVARLVVFLVRTMKPAGVRAWLESGEEPAATSFCFAGGPGLGFGEGALRGVTS